MDPFIKRIEDATSLRFLPYYGGELVSAGRELDALQGYMIDVAAPLLAPYQEGRFPLTDVTQLPTYDTTSIQITRAFQDMLDSEEPLRDGLSFYELEISSKDLVAWPVGATEAYSIATTGKELRAPDDFPGTLIRAGSALHTMMIENVGATPVLMPASQAYEALARGTIDGVVMSVGDWESYSLQELLRFAIVGLSFGHWESYLAMRREVWESLDSRTQRIWDSEARATAIENAGFISRQNSAAMVKYESQATASFIDIADLPKGIQSQLAKAATRTWQRWIEKVEANGHPGLATARLWANLVTQHGARLPEGVEQYLSSQSIANESGVTWEGP